MKSKQILSEILIDKLENPPSSDRYFLTDLKMRMETASLNMPSPKRTELSTGYTDSLMSVSAATVS